MIKRTHTCGELTLDNLNSKIALNGWISKIRDLGGLIFIDLRDHYGLTQCVVQSGTEHFKVLEKLKPESVILIIGKVLKRSKETINRNLSTGEIEIHINDLEILSDLAKWELLSLLAY